MVKFSYLTDGTLTRVIGRFGALNEPKKPMPAEVVAFTRITNEMVEGRSIYAAAESDFVADANIVIAHNANFDRRFAERYWPDFEHKPMCFGLRVLSRSKTQVLICASISIGARIISFGYHKPSVATPAVVAAGRADRQARSSS